MYKIQAVHFDKKKYSLLKSNQFIKEHFKSIIKKIDVTSNEYRYRLLQPSYLANLGYKTYITKIIKPGIKLIIAYKN